MPTRFLNRREASEYLSGLGLPVAVATLAKYATVGGGPEFQSFGRFPRYRPEALQRWAEARLSAPRKSTSDRAIPSNR